MHPLCNKMVLKASFSARISCWFGDFYVIWGGM
jgi:hypothetical protein